MKIKSIYNSFGDFVMKSVCRRLSLSIKMTVHCQASYSLYQAFTGPYLVLPSLYPHYDSVPF